MEYLIFIELGLVAIVGGIIFWVMRNIKREKSNQGQGRDQADKD